MYVNPALMSKYVALERRSQPRLDRAGLEQAVYHRLVADPGLTRRK